MQQPNTLVSIILSQLSLEPTDSSAFEQKFLRFALATQEALLPLEEISEVLNVRHQEILPMPEMPSCVLGIYNWRGKNLWLIDIGHLVDYPPLSGNEPAQLAVIVIQLERMCLGLVTSEVKDIELHNAQSLQTAETYLYPPRLLTFVKGYLPSAESLVLDIEAIARFPLWQVHRS